MPLTDPPHASPGAPLDHAVLEVRSGLRDAGVPDPVLFMLLGCGLPAWSTSERPQAPAAFLREGSLPLGEVPGVPPLWQGCQLVFGSITTAAGPTPTWLLEDPSLDAPVDPDAAPFERGFFAWVAAQAGARIMLHTSAGGLVASSELETGDLCLVRDYLNLSGSSPLIGIGPSKLGPLFPDLTRLFSKRLLHFARQRAESLGVTATEAVVAAAAPVSLATPAESAWFKTAGAEAWVQGIASPFLAAAHAGLEVLAIVALVGAEESGEGADVPAMLLASDAAAASLDALLGELAIPTAEAALAAREELP